MEGEYNGSSFSVVERNPMTSEARGNVGRRRDGSFPAGSARTFPFREMDAVIGSIRYFLDVLQVFAFASALTLARKFGDLFIIKE
ncbi:hypothetical protein SDJN03_16170, partial [Cucurbita argyrosperma subsp. sororia]